MHLRRLALTCSVALALPLAALADEPAPGRAPPPAGVAFEPGTPAFADVLAKARAEGKPAFLDFSTEWCGWCRRLEQDTFARPEVGEAMQAFVNVRLDAEKGEGPDLAKRFGVRGFPTLVVVDAGGLEIDRLVGYLPPDAFLEEIARIRRDERTLPALRRAYEAAPEDVAAGIAFGARLGLSDPEAAQAVFAALRVKAAARGPAAEAEVRLELAAVHAQAGRDEEARREAEALLRDAPGAPATAQLVARVGWSFAEAEPARALAFLAAARALELDAEGRREVEAIEIAVHQAGIAAALLRRGEAAGDDPEALNEAAWACFEHKVNLPEALAWAERAVEKSGGDPAVRDTMANLLWVLGRWDEAIAAEEKALEAAAENPMLRADLAGNLARWRVLRDEMRKAGAVPATPIQPAPAR